ncbi:MAG: hypothetical protein JO058_19685 [Alphaproteobacteria bacterium]|nr:hypothetical protein [Alphaproteobacteria bacterium]
MKFRENAAIISVVLLMLPIPAFAQTASQGGFDGVYKGVSNQMSAGQTGQMCRNPQPTPVPPDLVITNGNAQSRVLGGMQGTVNGQGVLSLRTSAMPAPVLGQIDAQGTARAQLSGFYCVYRIVWQKQR